MHYEHLTKFPPLPKHYEDKFSEDIQNRLNERIKLFIKIVQDANGSDYDVSDSTLDHCLRIYEAIIK
jgi:hypothetical protein